MTIDLFSVDLVGGAAGMSNVEPSVGVVLGGLAVFTAPVAFTSASGKVTVTGTPIPEPSTMLLLGSGLAGLVAWRMRKGTV